MLIEDISEGIKELRGKIDYLRSYL